MSMIRIGTFLGALGGVVAVLSVANGFVAVSADPQYRSRAIFAIAALVFGIIAAVSGFIPRMHPAAAGALMLAAGVLGFLATLPWYINTFYVMALPLWIIGAALLFASGRSPQSA
ncbi:MAG TPA: hypothetical protein VFN78_08340 [Ktedonobacterales bacterium]|nr:hypothetical protein [Ktedonobacterales bacterium]